MHSRYAVRHSHAIFMASADESRLAILRRNLRLEKAKYRILHGDEYKTKYELDDAALLDKEIGSMEEQIVELEARLKILDGVAQGYEGLRNAASREMFRRSSEQASKD